MNATFVALVAATTTFFRFDATGEAAVGSCVFKNSSVITVVPSVATCALLTSPGDEFVLQTDAQRGRDAAFLSVGFAKPGALCEFGRVVDHEALWFQCGSSNVKVFDPPPFVDGVWLTASWTYDSASRALGVKCGGQTETIVVADDWGAIRTARIGPTPGVLVHRIGERSGASVILAALDPSLCGPLVTVDDIRESVPVRPGVVFITGPGGGVNVARAFELSYCDRGE